MGLAPHPLFHPRVSQGWEGMAEGLNLSPQKVGPTYSQKELLYLLALGLRLSPSSVLPENNFVPMATPHSPHYCMKRQLLL